MNYIFGYLKFHLWYVDCFKKGDECVKIKNYFIPYSLVTYGRENFQVTNRRETKKKSL